MQIVRQREDLTRALAPAHASGTVALVPTMGALHAGHLALVAKARHRADSVVASIFVNPTQFGEGEDFGRYPRQEEQDLAMLRDAGCDFAWLPAVEDIYPPGFATTIHVAGVSDRWEGEARPGHFDGVATVVAKLFIAVMPDAAVFGQNDWQQLAVIKRMTEDLGLPIAVHGYPTVRESDGLAMSSRNLLLTADERSKAPELARAMEQAATAIGRGDDVSVALRRATDQIERAGFGPIDYLAYVDGDSLEPLESYRDGGRLIAAAFLGNVRLIDNIRVLSDTGRD